MASFDIEQYRREGEEFHATDERAYYQHYAGWTRELPIAANYEQHAGLFDPQIATELIAALDGASGDTARSLRSLAVFAANGAIEAAVRDDVQALAEAEAALTATVDGAPVAFRALPGLVANTPDADERERLEGIWRGLLERELMPGYAEVWSGRHRAARDLGVGSYRDLFARIGPADLDALAGQARRFLDDTADLYEPSFDAFLRRGTGIGLGAARSGDWRRAMRANHLDAHFPAKGLLPALMQTLDGLGLRLRDQTNITLDMDVRPGKANRAFCAAPVPPDEVYLVISPVGGLDDYSALFHEAGHAEHFAGMGRSLPFEFRCLGDSAVTETFAFLFEGLLHDRAWLSDVAAIRDTGDIVRHVGTSRLYFHRRYCAKLLYELELHHADDPMDTQGRYAELLSDATRLDWPAARCLEDVDEGFYATAYIRAWVLECGLHGYLRERFGSRWYRSREAGLLLRELWEDGQRLSAEELASELGLPPLDLALLAEDAAQLIG